MGIRNKDEEKVRTGSLRVANQRTLSRVREPDGNRGGIWFHSVDW